MANDPGVRLLRGGQGYFQVIFTHPDGRAKDVTFFRGAPTKVDSLAFNDPFGDATAQISFETITSYDSPGSGDLYWLVPWSQVTIHWWDIIDGKAVRHPTWIWEGFLISEEINQPYQLQCKGTLYLYDNYLAIPFYPTNPVPYELMMQRIFAQVPTKWNKAMRIDWPIGWNVTVPKFSSPDYMWYLAPWGVVPGNKWTGLTTRSTGSWEPSLTGYIQGLLATMYTPDGDQWTIMKAYGRQPVLRVREPLTYPNANTLVVYNGVPGVQVTASRDYSQTANVVYGTGQDLQGTAFTGAQVSSDGESTWYEPFAALPQVYPASASNLRRIPSMIRKETQTQFSQGIDEKAARDAAMTQIRRFADPGLTGSITLTTDPMLNELPYNRLLIIAGRQILVKNFRGADVLFHISSVSVSPEGGSVSLTVDTKFRDALTIAEVNARTRDAMNPVNSLKAGQVSALTNDVSKPWSYYEGSGVIPSGSKAGDATKFFGSMPTNTPFPWTDWTKKYPPSKYPEYYIKVSDKGGKAKKATDRWQDYEWSAKNQYAQCIPIKGAQRATIRLTQIAAYDKNGNVLAIPFHIGFYDNHGTKVDAMPMIPKNQKGMPHGYKESERYPFFPTAFNSFKRTGEQNDDSVGISPGTTRLAAWGTMEEPAGYWPSTKGAKGPVTGMLVDESTWELTADGNEIDINNPNANITNKAAGQFYAMIFQDSAPVAYFLGRCFRADIGSASA
jgi:hypothetical protein